MSVTLVINLPGVSSSKAQMVIPHNPVSAMVTVTHLVNLCPWMLLSTPWVCFTTMEFAVSGLLWPRLLAQNCFCECPCSISASVEVPGLGLVL